MGSGLAYTRKPRRGGHASTSSMVGADKEVCLDREKTPPPPVTPLDDKDNSYTG